VGKSEQSDEHILSTSDGIVTARSIRRRPSELAYSKTDLESACGAPWNLKAKSVKAPAAAEALSDSSSDSPALSPEEQKESDDKAAEVAGEVFGGGH